jgi:hypothetical protein
MTVSPGIAYLFMESWLGTDFRYLVFDNGKGERLVSMSIPTPRLEDVEKQIARFGLTTDLDEAPRHTKGRM